MLYKYVSSNYLFLFSMCSCFWMLRSISRGDDYTSLWIFAFAASDVMGWGIEDGVAFPSTQEAYRTAPYFYRNPTIILEDDAQEILTQRDGLLAYGIPAMTNAVGRQILDIGNSNLNLQDYCISDESFLWARGVWHADYPLRGRWLHSDIKDMAYPFARAFYKDLIQKGRRMLEI